MSSITGIVLRRRDCGEADRQLTILAQEIGKIEVIAKGARKSGSRLTAISEPLIVARFETASGKVRSFVTQGEPIRSFAGLRSGYDRLSTAIALCELTDALTIQGSPSDDLFAVLLKALEVLETHPSPPVVFVWTSLQILEIEGVCPSWTNSSDGSGILTNPAWVAPSAGGLLTADERPVHGDSISVSAECLLGLSATATCSVPPPHLKHTAECMRVLVPFLEGAAHQNLRCVRLLLD